MDGSSFQAFGGGSIKITVLGNGEKNKIKAEVYLQILKSHFVFLFFGLFQNCIIPILKVSLEECTIEIEKLQFGLSHTQLSSFMF